MKRRRRQIPRRPSPPTLEQLQELEALLCTARACLGIVVNQVGRLALTRRTWHPAWRAWRWAQSLHIALLDRIEDLSPDARSRAQRSYEDANRAAAGVCACPTCNRPMSEPHRGELH